MAWDAAMGALNAACLEVFGRQVSYRPAAGDPIVVTGILETCVRLEENAPGTYALLFLRATDLPSPPACGDEVAIDGGTYNVFEIEADAGGGVKLALRIR